MCHHRPGEFAPGLSLAVEMSAGKQEKFEVVAFREDQPLELYESNLRQAIESLHQSLGKGQTVVFSNGLYGQIQSVSKETVDIQVKSGAVMTVSRYAISEIVDKA